METENSDEEARRRDDELVREGFDRKPSPHPKLFMYGGPVNAFISQGQIFDSALVDDYWGLAKEAAARVTEAPDAVQKIIPVLFLYRHATELALKLAIMQLIRAASRKDTNLKSLRLDKHHLLPLLNGMKSLHKKANEYLRSTIGRVTFISKQAQDFITEIDAIDPTGMSFRYSRDTAGKELVTADADVGLEPLIAGMLHIERELDWYTLMIQNSLDLWDDWTADWEAELRSSF